MTKWEYQVLSLVTRASNHEESLSKQLNAQGANGWELVSVEGRRPSSDYLGNSTFLLIFKRPVKATRGRVIK